jgi:hypothetical protein
MILISRLKQFSNNELVDNAIHTMCLSGFDMIGLGILIFE